MQVRHGTRKLLAYMLSLAAIVAMAVFKAGDPYAVAAALAVFVGGNSAEHFAKRAAPRNTESK
jgi:hypothetical protein